MVKFNKVYKIIVSLKFTIFLDSDEILRIRMSYKSEKRVTRNGGQLCNFVGFDGTDEIQITCFTPEVKRFYDVIQVKYKIF